MTNEKEYTRMNILFFITPKSETAYLYDDCSLRQAIEKIEYHKSADDIQCEKPAVGPEITEENGQRPFGLKILGGHGALNLLFIYLPQRKRRCRFDFLLYHVFFRIASGGRWEF